MSFAAKRLWSSLSLLGFVLVGQDVEAAECVTSSGKTACGYHCLATEGQVRCSQTPEGVCSSSSGVVACWDPPGILHRVFDDGRSRRVPAPHCVTTYGQTACGYDCVQSDDRVQCAQTPFGACRADQGNLVCWDPPAAVVLSKGVRTPAAECIRNTGKVACGYHCLAHDGTLRCAQTPEGTCSVQQGKVICWDPPLDSYGVAFDPASELACLDAVEGRTCGFRCLATSMHSGCGQNRNDCCRVEAGEVVCRNPR